MGGIALFLYLIDVLSSLDVVIAVFGWAVMGGIFIAGLVKSIAEDDLFKLFEHIKSSKRYIVLACTCWMLAVVIPSQNTMYMMGGVAAVDAVSKMETVQQLGGEAGGLAIDTIKVLREKMNELSGDKTEAATTK